MRLVRHFCRKPTSPANRLCSSNKSTLSTVADEPFSPAPHLDPSPYPARSNYASLLQACLRQCKKIKTRHLFDEIPQRVEALRICKVIHGQSLKLGVGSKVSLGNAILDLYAKCGDEGFAEKAFRELEDRVVVAWNSILSMHSKRGELSRVIKLFGLIREDELLPNEFTYAVVFSACGRMADVSFGRQAHCDLIKVGWEKSTFCESSLIDMYAKCEVVVDARRVFDGAMDPDMVSWTAMISGYVQVRLLEEAIKLHNKMLQFGLVPDQVTSITIINAYSGLGRFHEAHELFSKIPNPNVVAWNVMISGHSQKGLESEALDLFVSMRKSGVKPTRSTLGSVLSAIASLGALDYGSLVHAEAIKLGLTDNVYVGSSLLNLYAKCEEVESAKKIFDALDEKNVILWNAMLGGYGQNGYPEKVIEMFRSMEQCGFQPDEYTYTSILSVAASLDSLEAGRQLHCLIIKKKLTSNLFVGNALVDMYAKCGALKDSSKQFEQLEVRDSVSWNAIIVGYVQKGEEDRAFEMFRRLNFSGVFPSEVALASILSACAGIQALERGKQCHCIAVKLGLETSLYSASSLIDMYAKCGEIRAARDVLSRMPSLSVVSMNAMIAGYAKTKSDLEEAISLFREMRVAGLRPSPITFASLLDACEDPRRVYLGKQIHCLVLKSGLRCYEDFLGVSLIGMYMNTQEKTDAHSLFLEFPRPKSNILWTVMISGYNQNDCNVEALQCFQEMRNTNILPDQATFASILKASSALSSLPEGRKIHSLVFHTGFNSDELTSAALIDMYAKCGEVHSSTQVFNEMETKTDVVSWNSMIVGFAKNGFAEEALKVFNEMKQSHSSCSPDDVTFLGVLTACSHAGLVSEGREIYQEMVDHYKIHPRADHSACMVDLFGRWGFLEEAERFIDQLNFEPDPKVWATLLSACRLHGDEIRGKRAAEKLIQSEPQNSSPYVLLSNIYAASGNWHEVNSLRREMREKGVKKLPGCSWVVVEEKTNLFVAGDESHPRAGEIRSILKDLTDLMRDDAHTEPDIIMLYGA
ncbi:hypothetical protein CDL15_Pgr027862 [Punica granatum]|uniref:Pentatricopeptide repeat-containing protein At3g09040, mitochondrial n=3 Tax=Punica granatum TaxID=22663 RepID=A0A218XIP0_PUNGR|nr:hypothetical protein CDL15_Pgr027862 [Punica granatum]